MSIEAIKAALEGARESLLAAHQQVTVARHAVTDAVALLTELSRDHSESLVPPQLRLAEERLGTGQAQVTGGIEAIERFGATL